MIWGSVTGHAVIGDYYVFRANCSFKNRTLCTGESQAGGADSGKCGELRPVMLLPKLDFSLCFSITTPFGVAEINQTTNRNSP